jgi:hypothetical protein
MVYRYTLYNVRPLYNLLALVVLGVGSSSKTFMHFGFWLVVVTLISISNEEGGSVIGSRSGEDGRGE